MDQPADIREIIERIGDVTADGPRYGCHFTVDFEGIPIGIFLKSWAFPAMKGSEATEHILGTEIPMKGVRQFGGVEGFPCMIKVKRGGKQQKAIIQHFLSGKWIPKVRAEYVGPGETAQEGEIIDFFDGKISTDQTSFEDDSNTENLTLEGEFKYKYWLAGS